MKKATSTTTAILLACAMMFVFGIVTAAVLAADDDTDTATAGVTQWQYCLLTVKADQPQSELGRQILKAGREGWELVSVENFSVNGTTTKTAFYFKRRL